jgi:peroxiredoxin Q/BCP
MKSHSLNSIFTVFFVMANLVIGQQAPNFTLKNQKNMTISLSDFAGKKNVVVYFYPKDGTLGCKIEAQEFTELSHEFDKTNTVVLGISKDSVESHEKFSCDSKLKINLLSDPEGSVCASYGALQKDGIFSKLKRKTFLVNKEGKLVKIWDITFGVLGHAKNVLEEVQRL